MKDFDSSKPSEGLGDTIAKITEATGIDKLTEIVTEVLGIKDCGCNRRREELNNAYPYSKPTNPPIFNPNEHPKAESGVYEVCLRINANKQGQQFLFYPGDKVLIDENHLLYPDWSYYLHINAVKKL